MARGGYAIGLCLAGACAPNLDLDGGHPLAARCSAALAPHDIQGPGGESPLVGQRLSVTGVVTLAPAGTQGEPGFFLQSLEEDDDTRTSEGLFVLFRGSAPAPGTAVAAVGVVVERASVTQLGSVEQLTECGRAALVPRVVDAVGLADPEPLENMLVKAHADWTVVDVTASPDAGSLLLSPRGRQFSTGHELGAAPGAEAQTWRLEPSTAAPLGLGSLPRRGARLATLTGVVSLEAATPSLVIPEMPVWSAEAPAPPARLDPSHLRLVALNLHGYVVAGRPRDTRSELELERQRDKLVAALRALDADVLALTELENAGSSGLEHLLEGLAERAVGEPLVFLEAPSAGGSELRAGIAFRPGRVSPLGPAWFDTHAGFRRAPLFQSFETRRGSFTLGVVHFKSKLCGDEPEVVPAEGCGADTRRAEAELLLESLRGLRERRPLEPLLVVGDLNSDPLEAAVQALRAGGLVDLLGALPSADRYSFVYEARASLLDHALGSPELATRVSGAIWHINADEPSFRDYSLDNPPELYVADARRCSDHDPVVLDLGF